MNKPFEYYLTNIEKLPYYNQEIYNVALDFYNSHKNDSTFDDFMNINCYYCTKSFCCINCVSCGDCFNCSDCKVSFESIHCQNCYNVCASIDCCGSTHCDWCKECFNCRCCSNCTFSTNCLDCLDCDWCRECKVCMNCVNFDNIICKQFYTKTDFKDINKQDVQKETHQKYSKRGVSMSKFITIKRSKPVESSESSENSEDSDDSDAPDKKLSTSFDSSGLLYKH